MIYMDFLDTSIEISQVNNVVCIDFIEYKVSEKMRNYLDNLCKMYLDDKDENPFLYFKIVVECKKIKKKYKIY